MIEIKERLTGIVCPRCKGTEIFRVTEIEDEGPYKGQHTPTKYTACFSIDPFSKQVCWYHIPARKVEKQIKMCKIEGCQDIAIRGRLYCTEHYKVYALERYYIRAMKLHGNINQQKATY